MWWTLQDGSYTIECRTDGDMRYVRRPRGSADDFRRRHSLSIARQIQRFVKLTEEQRRTKENKEVRDAYMKINRGAVVRLFKSYGGSEDTAMVTDGVLQFLEDLELDPMAVEVLVFCWLCDAKTQASFVLNEFALGLARLQSSNVDALKSSLRSATKEALGDRKSFEQLYAFAFNYMKQGSSLALEIATAYWDLLLSTQKCARLDDFVAFLQDEECVKKYDVPRSVSKDCWQQMLHFFREVNEDLTGYDDACSPTIADSFVEYMKSQKSERTIEGNGEVVSSGASTKAGNEEDDDMDW